MALKTSGLPKPRLVAGANCLAAAARRSTVKLLAFFKREKDGWEPLFGVESMLPAYSDLDPQWPSLVGAVEAALRWRAGAEAAPASAKDPWLQHLSYFWRSRGATDPREGPKPAEPLPASCE